VAQCPSFTLIPALPDHPARLVARAGGAGHSHDGEGCGCGGQHRPYERSFLFRLDADRHRRDFVIVRGSFGSRAVGAEAEISFAKTRGGSRSTV
jgi:hypothetical protein